MRESFERLRREKLARDEQEAAQALAALEARLSDSEVRWDETELREAIAPILAGTIRDAGKSHPEAVARAMAPHVVGTVRAEIKNSEDAIIDVLHPRLGRLIREGVSSAVADLQRQVDDALPIDRWVAGITGKLTGAPALGVLLQETEPFVIHEALLIERRSGRLLAREVPADTAAPQESDDDLVAGMIAALDSFASDALASDGGGTLRRIETEGGSLYLRASLTRIIALRTSGPPHADIEQRLDILLETLLEQAGENGMSVQTFDTTPLVREGVGQPDGAAAPPAAGGAGAFAMLAKAVGGIAALLLALWGHAAIEAHRLDRAVDAVAAAAQDSEAYRGYPLQVALDPDKAAIRVSGLAPDDAARARMLERLSSLPLVVPLRAEIAVAGRRLAQ